MAPVQLCENRQDTELHTEVEQYQQSERSTMAAASHQALNTVPRHILQRHGYDHI